MLSGHLNHLVLCVLYVVVLYPAFPSHHFTMSTVVLHRLYAFHIMHDAVIGFIVLFCISRKVKIVLWFSVVMYYLTIEH